MNPLLPGFEAAPSPYRHQPAPIHRVRESGPAALSDLEILAALTGSIDSAAALLDAFGSLRLALATEPALLETIPGIGPVVSARLTAMREAWHRVSRECLPEQAVTSPEDAYTLLAPSMRDLPQESFRVILLDHRKKVIRVDEVFRGTGNECFAHPPAVLRAALIHSASAIVVAHNHPSGDPSPSRSDHEATRRLKEACQSIGIELTDHIIIGRPGADRCQPYFSFREAGLL